jgi:hypothetical protein
MCVVSHQVTMSLWPQCTETTNELLKPELVTYLVQPPVWTQGDDVSLEMWLEHQTKMKFLVDLRKRAQSTPELHHLLIGDRFTIRGTMHGWLAPVDAKGNRRQKTYVPPDLKDA